MTFVLLDERNFPTTGHRHMDCCIHRPITEKKKCIAQKTSLPVLIWFEYRGAPGFPAVLFD
eukprot:scaffold7607_cov83-Cylindrotheca_fusiformis.AAC.2